MFDYGFGGLGITLCAPVIGLPDVYVINNHVRFGGYAQLWRIVPYMGDHRYEPYTIIFPARASFPYGMPVAPDVPV